MDAHQVQTQEENTRIFRGAQGSQEIQEHSKAKVRLPHKGQETLA